MFANTYHLRWIAGRANIVRKYIYMFFKIYIFSTLDVAFAFPFLSFPEAPASCDKK